VVNMRSTVERMPASFDLSRLLPNVAVIGEALYHLGKSEQREA
jgi:hypothetical protein